MLPTGDFQRFKSDILYYYNDDCYDEITFGILIADPRQSEAQEYIYNYLNVFHDASNKLFNFFIPGYKKIIYDSGAYNMNISRATTSSVYFDGSHYRIKFNNIEFEFEQKLFDEFCKELNSYFGIRYTFNPMLILMCMKPGHIHTARYIVIELDDNEFHSARRSGQFFMNLFATVRPDDNLEHIQHDIINTFLKGNLLDSIVNAISGSWLDAIKPIGKEIKRYRIKHHK